MQQDTLDKGDKMHVNALIFKSDSNPEFKHKDKIQNSNSKVKVEKPKLQIQTDPMLDKNNSDFLTDAKRNSVYPLSIEQESSEPTLGAQKGD